MFLDILITIRKYLRTNVSKRYSTDFNSNKSPLPGVQLTATDAPATDTDASGNFQFNFSKQKPGMAIASPNVYKKGYELVNKDMINGWILSEKRPMSIVMAPEGTIEESKNKYYSISVAHFSKKQEKAIEEINQLYIAQKLVCKSVATV